MIFVFAKHGLFFIRCSPSEEHCIDYKGSPWPVHESLDPWWHSHCQGNQACAATESQLNLEANPVCIHHQVHSSGSLNLNKHGKLNPILIGFFLKWHCKVHLSQIYITITNKQMQHCCACPLDRKTIQSLPGGWLSSTHTHIFHRLQNEVAICISQITRFSQKFYFSKKRSLAWTAHCAFR